LKHVWPKIIRLKSSHNPEWELKGLSEAIWKTSLFKMAVTMSNFALLWRRISYGKPALRGRNFGEWLNLVQGFYQRRQKYSVFELTFSFN